MSVPVDWLIILTTVRANSQQLLTHHHSLCSKPRFHIWWTPHFFLTRSHLSPNLAISLLYSSASLYPTIPRYQNSFHGRHLYCSLQAWLLQLSLSQPAQVSDHPAPTDPELSRTCCCESSQELYRVDAMAACIWTVNSNGKTVAGGQTFGEGANVRTPAGSLAAPANGKKVPS